MRRLSTRGRSKSSRASAFRVEGLEDRSLLSTTPLASLAPLADVYFQPQYELMSSASTTAGSTVGAQTSISPAVSGFSPAQITQAYGVNKLSENGAGQTIAIVDAYDLSVSAITNDLTQFDTQFSLPAPPKFTVDTPTNPKSNSGWDLEIALDVEWAHAIAPDASILLVEAASASGTALLTGVQTAATTPGVSVVSMSWGGDEPTNEAQYNSYFETPGVSFVASSGDAASAVYWPGTTPYVTSVGGTSLYLSGSNNYSSESVWTSGGGGVSAQYTLPPYQTGFVSSSIDPSVDRAVPDVAYVADPNTGVAVYNGGWGVVGGTSVGAPQWSALLALANQGRVTAGESTIGISSADAYGANTLLYQLAGSTSYTNPYGDFHDITSGSNGSGVGHTATTGYDLATGLGSPVANHLIPDLISPGSSNPPTVPTLGDSGFEQVQVGAGNYQYNPAGSAWTFSPAGNGGSGLAANNSGFTAGNPAAPQGNQVAFLQGQGSITQSVAGWAAGSYTISFDAAQRGNQPSSQEDFELLIDGNVVSTFKPVGATYQSETTATFTVTAGAHTIEFLGLDSVGGDNTALIDAVTVAVSTTTPTVPTIGDSGFEQVQLGSGNFAYNPTGSAWTYSASASNGGSGLAANNSGFTGNLAAPQGDQAAFLQGQGSITQSVAGWAAGSYTISFDAAQRGNQPSSQEDFELLIDGNVVSTFKPVGATYQSETTATFTVTAGAHTIEFLGLDSVGGDNTALIDAVTVAVSGTIPTVPTIGDSGFEQVQLGSGNFAYNPTGSAWTYSASASNGGSGLAANNSGFTGNLAAPQGDQVAFLQGQGSITQSVAGWSAGSYSIFFDAAQRGNQPSSQEDFELLIDGKVVSTFKPTGSTYQSETTTTFTVTAGTHTIEFLGLDSVGGDNTALIDAVTISST